MNGMNVVEHEKFKEWLHKKREERSSIEQEALEGHLSTCDTCRAYAQTIQALGEELRTAFQSRWDHVPVADMELIPPTHKRLRAAPALAVTMLAIAIILVFSLRAKLAEILPAAGVSQAPEGTMVSEIRVTNTNQATQVVSEPTLTNEHLIAFVSRRDGNREIYVMSARVDAVGESLKNLTNHPAQDYAPVWSPDGERIAFVSDRNGQPGLFVMQADGSQVTSLILVPDAQAYGEPSWSPDGQQIAVQLILRYPYTGEAYTQIYLVEVDGSGATAMTQTEFPLSNLEPKWSPVGNRIASRTLGIVQAFPGGTTSGEPEQIRLSRGLANVGSLAWSPDGALLAYFASCRSCIDGQDLTPAVHLIEADGDNPQVLVPFEQQDLHGLGLSWSPDGSQLLLLATEVQTGIQHLYLIVANSGQVTHLAELPVGAMQSVPDWSPDGSQLVYALQENGASGIYILDLNDRLSDDLAAGKVRLSASRGGDSSPRWQP